ncbi:MAG: hypothetical protein ABI639_10280 [Thermoanaerobaculia bacterium]
MRPFAASLLGLACVATFSSASPLRAADGDLDASFQGGAIRVLWGNDAATANELLPLADGRLLVGGTIADPKRWAVAKISSTGALNLDWQVAFTPFGFGNDGAEETGEVYDLWRDPSGASETTSLLGWVKVTDGINRPALARLTAAGALDATFDGNGLKIVSPAPAGWTNLFVNDGKFLPDGGAVFVGSCKNCPTADVTRVFVAKLLPSGALDTGFSGDGWISLSQSLDASNYGSAVAIDANGRIVVACGSTSGMFSSYFVARLTATGAFDGSFGGGDGINDGNIAGGFSRVTDVSTDPSSGRIAIGLRVNATYPQGAAVDVLTAAGLDDDTFSGDGHIDLDLEEGSSVDSVVFQSDGKVLAVGNIDPNGVQTGGFFLARMLKSGALDASFDGNGVKRVEFDAAANVDDGALVVRTWGGRLLAAGYAGAGGGDEQAFALVRTENHSIFADGFERGSAGGWPGF